MVNDLISGGKPDSSVVSFEEAKILAGQHGTPLLVCDLDRVRYNYKRLKESLRGFELYYAVKANPHPEILKTLVGLGSCFDVASKNEISACLEAGAKPEHLLYANPVKPREHIAFAHENGIKTFTYDSKQELEKMAKYAPGCNVILRLSVRDVGSLCKFSTKFGAKGGDAIGLLDEAVLHGLHPIGLSFHVGSQCTNMENFASALDACDKVFKSAEARGLHLSILDTGGGIPIKYVKDVYSLEEISKVILEKIAGFPKSVKPIAEPGRILIGDTMTLVTRVIGVGKRNGNNCIYLDDGCYNSLSEKIFGHCEYKLISDRPGPLDNYTAFGPTCDSVDVISRDASLPNIEENDILLVPNAGAYTNAAATHFNGFEPAKIVFLPTNRKA
jgi:ornithine decarboxylase